MIESQLIIQSCRLIKQITNDVVRTRMPSLLIFLISILRLRHSPMGCAGYKKNIPLGVAGTRWRCQTAVLISF